MSHLLIYQMCNKSCGRYASCLIITFVASFKIKYQSLQQKLDSVRKFCVSGTKGGVQMGKCWRRHLCLHNRQTKNTSATDNILSKQLMYNDANVWTIYFVYEAINRFLRASHAKRWNSMDELSVISYCINLNLAGHIYAPPVLVVSISLSC